MTTSPIYVFTVMKLDRETGKVVRSRTWGWFQTLAMAEKAVKENHGDMFEDGYYNAAVIEAFASGPIAIAESEHWFSVKPIARPRKGRWRYSVQDIGKPKSLANVVSFGMG